MRLAVVGVVIVFIVALLLWPDPVREKPTRSEVWSDLPEAEFPRHPWGQYLQHRIIGLDPGHGGISGDHGQGFEGPVNLRVALELKKWLEAEGARVILTRTDDSAVGLKRRPVMCEQEGAEIFVSIHHNASAGNATNVNYTSTYYHGSEDHEPASLDLARAIQRGVIEQLRTEHRVPMPVLSDHLVYKGKGFAVLRHARIPAVLCEASFYTNPEERERLKDDLYVKREAYGYYRGLVEYFTGGTPTARIQKPKNKGKPRKLRVYLDDGLKSRGGWGAERQRILEKSIVCSIDDKAAKFTYDRKKSILTIDLPKSGKILDFSLHFENLYKHSNFPTNQKIVLEDGRWVASQ